MIFASRPPAQIFVEAPCRICGQAVRVDARNCPRCGAANPVRESKKASGFEWQTEAELFGFPLIHIATGRDASGKLRVAKGVIAIGQFAVGAVAIAQFGAAFIFGFGQFMAAPIAVGQVAIGLLFGLGQMAIGYAAIGQLAVGFYAIGQFGFAGHFYGPGHHDPQALEFFRIWAEKLGSHVCR